MLVIEKLMREQGLSQAKVARLADVNASSLNRIIRGKEPVYPYRGRRIADALGWRGPVKDLFSEVVENDD